MSIKISGIVATVVCLCGAAAAGAPSPAPDVHVGDNWKFRTLDGFTNETQFEATHRVVEINDREIVMEVHNLGKDKTGIRYFTREWNAVDTDDGKYDPYYPEFKFPLAAGATWSEKYTWLSIAGVASSGYVTAKVSGPEKVTVPAGSFDAYRIDRDQEVRGNNESAVVTNTHMTTWYAPAVRRFVRREWTVTRDGRVRSKTAMELVEYTLAEQKAALTTAGQNESPRQ
jgi:hypothetical protein